MDVWAFIQGLEVAWTIVSSLAVVAALLAGGHVVLSKRDTRSAVGWLGLIVLVPLLGTTLYLLLGINRIRRRAVALRPTRSELPSATHTHRLELPAHSPQLHSLADLMGRVTGEPLARGNTVTPLDDGDEAYPRMLAAIDGAERSVWLSTYIFEALGAGARFIDALARAHDRGVQVRVLIDAVGLRYARPRAQKVLQRRGVPVAAFLPALNLGYSRFYNLRNHRKILVVDGEHGFTGGMNIRQGHVLSEQPVHPIHDMHFEIRGPVAAWLAGVFADDWEFASRESLARPSVVAASSEASHGPVLARGVVDGPDANINKVRWSIMGGLSCATRSVRVVTPYFLPDSPLLSALNVAALRGLRVDVVVPEQGNLTWVNWAMRAHLAYESASPVNYWLSPAPFDHTKLLVVDEAWSLIGTANWDPRSLRLNFEVAVECYDAALGEALARRIDARIARSKPLSAAGLDQRSLPIRLRDGVAHLLTPYL